jgi:glycine oxidase
MTAVNRSLALGDRPRVADAIIIGDGIIGLAIALALGLRGARCRVLGARQPGMASTAAAGLLAPSVARLPAAVRPFFYASLDRFPLFLERLHEFDPTLATIDGLLQITSDEEEWHSADPRSVRLDGAGLAELEPALAATPRALLHPRDGAVDNVRLLAAMERAVASASGVDLVADDPVTEIDCRDGVARVRTSSGTDFRAATVVLAAGAWSGRILGLPRPLPVSPLKGQMLALGGAVLQHGVMSEEVYLVPRGSETLVGATSEHAGFDVSTTEGAIAQLRAAAVALCPALAGMPIKRSWAGVRPATPDMLPILGRDPDHTALVYACGHSRNGILLAPATGEVIGALVAGEQPPLDIGPFRVERFGTDGA